MSEKLTHLISVKAPAAARSQKLKRLAMHCLLLSLSLLLPISTPAQPSYSIQTGLPINLTTITLHVQGQPINVYEFTVSLYRMNTPPPWPVGLWLYSYVQADTNNGLNLTWGQGRWCQWWFSQVATLEQQNQKQVPYPFFEMNLPTSVTLIQTDEGILIYPEGSVTCWQAENGFAP